MHMFSCPGWGDIHHSSIGNFAGCRLDILDGRACIFEENTKLGPLALFFLAHGVLEGQQAGSFRAVWARACPNAKVAGSGLGLSSRDFRPFGGVSTSATLNWRTLFSTGACTR